MALCGGPTTTVTPGQVHVTPSAEGMPGAEMIETLLNWAQMVALWGSLGALFAGAAMYGLAVPVRRRIPRVALVDASRSGTSVSSATVSVMGRRALIGGDAVRVGRCVSG